MKNSFAVTISDVSGSRHYTVKKTFKRYLLLALLFLVLVVGSISYSVMQYQYTETLYERSVHLDDRNARLNETLVFQHKQLQEINKQLDEIERIGRLELSDEQADLVERARKIREFYHSKEVEYTEIDERLASIEERIADMRHSPEDRRKDEDREEFKTIPARVDMVELDVQQEAFMFGNIPNGFPTKSTKITSPFGYRTHPVTNKPDFHSGVDIRARIGAKVRATADGIVTAAKYSKYIGNRVIVRHNYGFESYYGHLHKMLVKPGDVIHKGQVIGVAGNSGRSTGPHLQYEVRYLGKPLDPDQFLLWEFGSREIFTQVEGVKWASLVNLIDKQIAQPTLQLSRRDPVSPEKPR